MVNIVISNDLRVSNLPNYLWDTIKERLSYENPDYVRAVKYSGINEKYIRIPKYVKLWSYAANWGYMSLPRGFHKNLIDLLRTTATPFNIKIDLPTYNQIHIAPQIKLRSYQEKMAIELMSYNGLNGIAKAPCGTGKTFLGLEVARRIGYRILWLVHNDRLLKQALKSAETVLGLSEDEIGIIKSKKETIGDFLTIASIQTLHKRPIVKNKWDELFGLLIIDEVHHAPAYTWTNVINQFKCLMCIGLTATPRRSSGLTQVLLDCMGNVITTADRDLLLESGVLVPVDAYYHETNIDPPNKSFPALVNWLANNEQRNKIIINIIQKELKDDPHSSVVVLSDRRHHVERLHQMCLQTNLKALKMMGQMSNDEERRVEAELESERCRILISTFNFLSEGFDYNPLNIIIPATPFRNPIRLEQAIGRTQRPTPYKRKSKYIDLVDSSGLLVNQFSTRYSELQDQDIPIFTYQLF